MTHPPWPVPPINVYRANTHGLGARSLSNLALLHPAAAVTVRVGHWFLPQSVDFMVFETERDRAAQPGLVASGRSKTLNSKHFKQSTGFAHAADLVPWLDGELKWDMEACIVICKAMVIATSMTAVNMRWGGSWTVLRPDFDPRAEMAAYKARKGDDALVDGPHFEMV